jgi:hypothetical protein
MGTQYNGIPSRITLPGSVNISSMTGSGVNPIVANTASPHGLTTGDKVRLFDCIGNTAANGTWDCTVTGASQFTIPTTGNGTYSALLPGSVQPLTYGSTFQVISDGDLLSASNLNVAPEALGDRTALDIVSTGAWKLAATGSTGAESYTIATNYFTIVTPSSPAAPFAFDSNPIFTWSSLQLTDLVDFEFNCQPLTGALIPGDQLYLSVGATSFVPGSSAGTPTRIPNIGATVGSVGCAEATAPVTIKGQFRPTVNGNTSFYAMAKSNHGGGSVSVTVTLTTAWSFRYRVWRPTGVPQ